MNQLVPFTGFLGWLVSTSIMASILGLGILLVKTLFKNKLGARWHSAIWLLLYLRLILPWTPESSISMFNWLPSGLVVNISQTNTIQDRNLEMQFPINTENQNAAPQNLQSSESQGNDFNINWPLLIWLTVEICFLGCLIIPYIRFTRSIRKYNQYSGPELNNLLAKCKLKLRLNSNLPIIETPLVKGPVLFGFIKPKLLLPPNLQKVLNLEQLEHIFLHELAHLKRKDILINWLMNLLQAMHWFNPVLWYAFRRARLDQEIACDALALTYLPKERRREYGYTIIHLLQSALNTPVLPGISHFESGTNIRRRIKMIKEFKRIPIKWTLAGIIIAVIFGVITLTNATNKTSNIVPIEPNVQVNNSNTTSNTSNNDLTKPSEQVNNSTVVDYDKVSDAATKFVNDKGYKVSMNGIGAALVLLPNSFEDQIDEVKIGELLAKYNQISKQNGLDFSGYLGKKVYFFAIGLDKDNKSLDQQMILLLDGAKVIGYWMDDFNDEDNQVNNIPGLLTVK